MSRTGSEAIVTDLRARGYAVLPAPQVVQLHPGEVVVDDRWRIVPSGIDEADIAVRTLADALTGEHGLKLELGRPGGKGPAIRLAVRAGSVDTGYEDTAEQGYALTVAGDGVEIVGNGPAGLFYGVQTLIQLLDGDGRRTPALPLGVIRDWPRLGLRIIHWDTKHHQDRMETCKRYLDWCARFKANAVAFELEDKFEYPSNPIIGAPGAFTTAQMQELTDYALDRHIQLIPDVQSPAHLGYVLKHEQFAHLRCDGNNYMACLDDPAARKLIFQMYEDVCNATKGAEYFLVSTDEVYYAGICEKHRKPYNPENRSLTWIDYANAAHEFLAPRGRKVIVWIEYPVLPEHVRLLHPDIIDGVGTGGEAIVAAENECGTRQIGYVSMQGEERLFPNYFSCADQRFRTDRLRSAYEALVHPRGVYAGTRWIGSFIAAWGDAGLHNETFWLGWAAGAAFSWNGTTATIEQTVADFMDLYYGRGAADMVAIYQEMQAQARFWYDSWLKVPSRVRPPAYGNSRAKKPTGRTDLTLTPPGLPSGEDLAFEPAFGPTHAQIVAEAPGYLLRSDRLIGRLQANLTRPVRNRQNLEIFLSLAHLARHHLRMILALAEAEKLLAGASAAAKDGRAAEAADQMTRAHLGVGQVLDELQKVYARLVATWEKGQFPKNRSVDGRDFVHVMDDVKDHFADRRMDLSYMIAPAESVGLSEWRKALWHVIADYAGHHGLTVADPDPGVVD